MKKYGVLKMITAILLTAIMAVGMFGCNSSGTGGNTTTTTANNQGGTTTPAQNNGTTTANNNTTTTANTKPINIVWYPNESAADYQSSRDEFARLVSEATHREVNNITTTDYTIAIESLASGAADIGAVMGAIGYIQAKNKNPNVDVLFVNSGVSGTLDDAVYYSWLCVPKGEEDNYKSGDSYSIENIPGKKMSFVSNSSTSGFRVPTSSIISYFSQKTEWAKIDEDMILGLGSKSFFGEVLFGQSHQGSAVNLLSGKADIAAFCDTELAPYTELASGTMNRIGAVYTVKQGASAPFDAYVGKQFVAIAVTPVLNGPNCYNPQNLSPEEIQAIRDIFTSEETANNLNFFAASGSGSFAFYKKTNNERYVLVEDSWYDPIRELS